MPKIIAEITYPVNLEHYPDHIKTETDAMIFDCEELKKDNGDMGLMIENGFEIVGVQDDNGEIIKL